MFFKYEQVVDNIKKCVKVTHKYFLTSVFIESQDVRKTIQLNLLIVQFSTYNLLRLKYIS